MKVNMTPNPLDVVTIHASQGDTEARQWEFELHNNGELIDTSEITEQLFFKAYKGGTEQILPGNTSTPTTSPFLGDIKYPQGLLSDQEFLYRESPTEEDGLAWIKSIKGNTLVWNQLVQNGNFADTSNWQTEYNATVSVSNNVLSITPTEQNGRVAQKFTYTANHKLLIMADVKLSSTSGEINRISLGAYAIDNTAQSSTRNPIQSSNWQKLYVFCYSASTHVNNRFLFTDGRTSDWGTTQIRNFMAFDLTSMFGETKANELFASEQSQVGKGLLEFTSLFPLPYYAYNQGSLLSFNGNGIKTVGKNLLDPSSRTTYDGVNGTRWYESQGFMLMANKTYTFSASNTGGSSVALYIVDHATRNTIVYAPLVVTYTPTQNVIVYLQAYRGSGIPSETEFQLELGSQTSYEPYTSSTLSLPISTYFPTGMKSAGTVYDELSNTKASVRIGSITVNGSEAWVKSTSYPGNYYILGLLSDVKYPNPNAISNSLILVYNTTQLSANDLCFMFDGSVGSYNVNIKNTSMTTLDQFKAWLQANPVTIYYELKTPTETSFTTASLVTENAEIPLSNEDGVLIGKCTEQLSENPGFIDAKIKLSDADGECYSNKIQLHVERSPQ